MLVVGIKIMKKILSLLKPSRRTSSPSRDFNLDLGKMANERISFFLDTSSFPSVTPELYTELYALVFIVTHAFVDKEISALLSWVEKSLFDAYENEFKERWPDTSIDIHTETLDLRLKEYTLIIRNEQNPTGVITKKTASYLSHASALNEYFKENSPIALTNPLEDLEVMKNLVEFYEKDILSILKGIRAKKDAIQSAL